jgi:hypothetical protein
VPPLKGRRPRRRSPFPVPLSSNSAHRASPPSPLSLVRFGPPECYCRFSPPSVSSSTPPSSFSFRPCVTPVSLSGAPGRHHCRRRHRRSSLSPEHRRRSHPHPPRHRPTVTVRISSPHLARPPLRSAPVEDVRTSSSERPPASRAGHATTLCQYTGRFRGWVGPAGRSHGLELARYCAQVFDFRFLLYFQKFL